MKVTMDAHLLGDRSTVTSVAPSSPTAERDIAEERQMRSPASIGGTGLFGVQRIPSPVFEKPGVPSVSERDREVPHQMKQQGSASVESLQLRDALLGFTTWYQVSFGLVTVHAFWCPSLGPTPHAH